MRRSSSRLASSLEMVMASVCSNPLILQEIYGLNHSHVAHAGAIARKLRDIPEFYPHIRRLQPVLWGNARPHLEGYPQDVQDVAYEKGVCVRHQRTTTRPDGDHAV